MGEELLQERPRKKFEEEIVLPPVKEKRKTKKQKRKEKKQRKKEQRKEKKGKKFEVNGQDVIISNPDLQQYLHSQQEAEKQAKIIALAEEAIPELNIPKIDTSINAGEEKELFREKLEYLEQDKAGIALEQKVEPVVESADLQTIKPLKQIGEYVLAEKIGEGAFCNAYRAKSETGRTVCLKVLKDGVLSDTLKKQVKINHKLNHKYILPIEQFDLEGDPPWFVMKYIEKGHLDTKEEKKLEEILDFFYKLCEGVNYAHENGVLHRDLKPRNILVDQAGDDVDPLITDFGISQLIGMDSLEGSLVSGQSPVGTIGYLAPDKLKALKENQKIEFDIRDDVYSMGALLYEMLSHGEIPGTDIGAELAKNEINTELINVVKKATTKNPDERYQTINEFREALKEIDLEAVIETWNTEIEDETYEIATEELSEEQKEINEKAKEKAQKILSKLEEITEKIKCNVSSEFETRNPYRSIYLGSEKFAGLNHTMAVNYNPNLKTSTISIPRLSSQKFRAKITGDKLLFNTTATPLAALPFTEITLEEYFKYVLTNPPTSDSKKDWALRLFTEVFESLPDELEKANEEAKTKQGMKKLENKRTEGLEQTKIKTKTFTKQRKADRKSAKRTGKSLESNVYSLFSTLDANGFEFETEEGLKLKYSLDGKTHHINYNDFGNTSFDIRKKKKWWLFNKLEIKLSPDDLTRTGLLGTACDDYVKIPELVNLMYKNPVPKTSTQEKHRQKLISKIQNLPEIIGNYVEGDLNLKDDVDSIFERQKREKQRILYEYETEIKPSLDELLNSSLPNGFRFELNVDEGFTMIYKNKDTQKETKRTIFEKLVAVYDQDSENRCIEIRNVNEHDCDPFMIINKDKFTFDTWYHSLQNLLPKQEYTHEEFKELVANQSPIGEGLYSKQIRCFMDVMRKLNQAAVTAVNTGKTLETPADPGEKEKPKTNNLKKLKEKQAEYAKNLREEYTTKIQPGIDELFEINCSDFEFEFELENPFIHCSGEIGKNTKEYKKLIVKYDSKNEQFDIWDSKKVKEEKTEENNPRPFMKIKAIDLYIDNGYHSMTDLPHNGDTTIGTLVEYLAENQLIGEDYKSKQYKCFMEILRRLPAEVSDYASKKYDS